MANQCKGCKKFQKKQVQLIDGLCPKCLATANTTDSITKDNKEAITMEKNEQVVTPEINADVELPNALAEMIAGGSVKVEDAAVSTETAPATETENATPSIETAGPATEGAQVNETTPTAPAKIEIPAELKDILEAGRKGVTNKQMIPAMKKAVDENDVEKLQLLKQHFGPVFESTTKYIGKERQEKLKQIV